MQKTPKTDLHAHGLLSAPFPVYEEIAGRTLPKPPSRFKNFEVFNQYLFQNLISIIKTPEHIRKIIQGAFQRLIEDHVVFAEMSFDLLIPDLIKIAPEEFIELLVEGKKKVSSFVNMGLEIGISRKLSAAEARLHMDPWLESGIFSSVDLYDDERLGRVEDFVPLYQLCEKFGLKRKAHVGEFGTAASVQETVEKLDLHAVQHGIRAVDDPKVMAFLAKRGTGLNICPTSNVSLGACTSYEQHPAKKLFEAGVKITVNSDDYTLFGTTVSQELENLKKMGFVEEEIKQVIKNGFESKENTHGVQSRF